MIRFVVTHARHTLALATIVPRKLSQWVLIALSAGLYASCSPEGNPEPENSAPETMQSVAAEDAFSPDSEWPLAMLRNAPVAYPPSAFLDADLQPVWLNERNAKLTVLNFWATWCGPCKEEMPSLDALQARFDPKDIYVLTLSNDRKGPEVVLPYFEKAGLTQLKPYYEENLSLSRVMGVQGYPNTVVLDQEGRELARVVKPADWNGPEAVGFLEKLLALQN